MSTISFMQFDNDENTTVDEFVVPDYIFKSYLNLLQSYRLSEWEREIGVELEPELNKGDVIWYKTPGGSTCAVSEVSYIKGSVIGLKNRNSSVVGWHPKSEIEIHHVEKEWGDVWG